MYSIINILSKCYVHYGDLILRELDCIVIISFGYILYGVCFNLYCGGFKLFCDVCVGVWVCVCVCMGVCGCVCVCGCGVWVWVWVWGVCGCVCGCV
jgi:hypothetical protein